MAVSAHASTPLGIDRLKKKWCFRGDVLLACELGAMESFTCVTGLCSWLLRKVTIAYPVHAFVSRMVELSSLAFCQYLKPSSCSSPSDWGRHVAEILLGRSLQWNVHRVSLQCLRGSVLPYCLWVSDHSHMLLGPQGYSLGPPQERCPPLPSTVRALDTSGLCPVGSAVGSEWEGGSLSGLCLGDFCWPYFSLQSWESQAWSIICTKLGTAFSCRSWIMLPWCRRIYEGEVWTQVSDFTSKSC